MSTSLRTLKGVGEKTEKLFAKIGVTDMESLLSYYPRNYDAYEEPVEIRSLEEGVTFTDVLQTRLKMYSRKESQRLKAVLRHLQ